MASGLAASNVLLARPVTSARAPRFAEAVRNFLLADPFRV